MKKAIITGITGQDGSYLAELLLSKGYEVHGIKRRSSIFNTNRVDHLYQDADIPDRRFILHYGELNDTSNLLRIIQEIRPDEIYNLGAQSHVGVSFESPEYTADTNGLGTLRLLEAIRILGLVDKTKFYQASTSELFGKVQTIPQNEKTPFYPRSPYACAKLYAYWLCVNYRESYGMYACNGILFNHESPRRGETFVTRKITRGFPRVLLGLTDGLTLGNLNSMRDWGHARDYVYMQWLMLQQEKPDDYVIATGRQLSVRNFINKVAENLGVKLDFTGSGVEEKAYVTAIDKDLLHEKWGIKANQIAISPGDAIIGINPRFFRPAEVDTLLGDAAKARERLGWIPKTSIEGLICEMLFEDVYHAKRDAFLVRSGYNLPEPNE